MTKMPSIVNASPDLPAWRLCVPLHRGAADEVKRSVVRTQVFDIDPFNGRAA